MIRVMLSLDLVDAEDKRSDFYKYLTDAGWKKAKNVDTVWLKNFSTYSNLDDTSLGKLRQEVMRPLFTAYKELDLKQIYLVAQLGNHTILSYVVERRQGTLSGYPAPLHD